MSKKVKINGKWVTVDDKDIKDDAPTEDPPAEDPPVEDPPAEDPPAKDPPEDGEDGDDGDKAILAEARKIGEKISQEISKSFDTNDSAVKEVSVKVNKMMEVMFGNDSKLNKILNGKDLFLGTDELTKEEKIVGFYYALITDNKMALKALSEGTDADGGYLFPNEFLQELIRELPEINELRKLVRIIPMRRNKMDITNLVSGPKMTWTGENVAKSTTTARFAQQTLTAFKCAAILYSSDELIEDSDIFDVVQLIISLFAEAIADEEEKVLAVGDGTTQPQGLDTATVTTTTFAGQQDFDGLKTLKFALPRKYRKRAVWILNDSDWSEIAKLKDGNGRYFINDNVKDSDDHSLMLGKPVIVSDWIPLGTIFFGDLKKAYFLGDRKRMTVKISQDTTQAFTQDMTAIRVVFRIGGLVVLPNALRKGTGFSA